ncbi:uncharacterized protein [Ciconia boyciana]|uniref:uncharacterized protein isoform X1 n=1 Tax=Ciconia boyciana TaxID=52775 RepID=UPI003BA398F2
MDKAGSLHTSVPTPPPRLYLPRNFSCSACLYGSLAEQCKGGCSPDGDAAPTPVVREAAGEKPPPPPRGREPSLPAVPPSPTQRRRAKSLPTPGDRSLRPALQQSPSRRKTVRFADSLGLELTSVRHFCEADLPQVPLPAPPRAADLFKTRKPPALGDLEPVLFGPPPPLLEPLFPPQPGASPGFAERVRQHKPPPRPRWSSPSATASPAPSTGTTTRARTTGCGAGSASRPPPAPRRTPTAPPGSTSSEARGGGGSGGGRPPPEGAAAASARRERGAPRGRRAGPAPAEGRGLWRVPGGAPPRGRARHPSGLAGRSARPGGCGPAQASFPAASL